MNSENSGSRLEQLIGGRDCVVRKQDGATDTVKVRHLRISDLNNYATSTGDETALLALYTGRTQEWVESLTDESQIEILTVGDALNSFLADALALRIQRQARLMPAEVQKALSALPNTAPGSLPKAV